MRDHDQCSRPRVEQILGGRQHVDINIIGGLIEHQDVGLGQQGQHQLQPTALAAGQLTHPGRELIAAKSQALQQLCRSQLLTVDLIPGLESAQNVAHQIIGDLNQLAGLLIKHGQLHGLAALDPALIRSDGPGDQTQQCGLACAVGADDAGALARGDTPLDIAQDRLVHPIDSRVGHRDVQ